MHSIAWPVPAVSRNSEFTRSIRDCEFIVKFTSHLENSVMTSILALPVPDGDHFIDLDLLRLGF